MKVIIFDVGDAACSLVVSPEPRYYGMMIDCGCAAQDSDKKNPIDVIDRCKKWLSMSEYKKGYPLTLLHITHPDDDHVRNAGRISKELPPYLLRHTYTEEFPDSAEINGDYKESLDRKYRTPNTESIDWGLSIDKTFSIPIDKVKNDSNLNTKIRNNSSILRFLKYNNTSILFAGDLERPAWEWLKNNDSDFCSTIKSGVNILIAPHHGHKSGFPNALFELCNKVDVVIHSKDSEAEKTGPSDVASQYTQYAKGIKYKSLSDEKEYYGKVLTTRSNGCVYIDISSTYGVLYYTDKASPNHIQR